MTHVEIVINKLTQAGFTINMAKCQFCKEEVKFLGHLINKEGVSADPERTEAILRYPTPRNCKQLRQFLGVCNFHSHFIIGYTNYATPLYSLLKQGNKWEWNAEKQDAFLLETEAEFR
jgi:hypothetical protein